MRRINKCFLILVILFAFPLIVNAGITVNIDGKPSGGSGSSGNGAIIGTWVLGKGAGLAVNLVKASDSGIEVISKYNIIWNGSSSSKKQFYNSFMATKSKPADYGYNTSGSGYVCGTLNSGTYGEGCYYATTYSEDMWFGSDGVMLTIDSSKIIKKIVNTKGEFQPKFYEMIERLFNEAGSKMPSVLNEYKEATKFKTLLKNRQNPAYAEQINILKDYKLIIEPIYYFYNKNNSSERKFVTIKEIAIDYIKPQRQYGGLPYNDSDIVYNLHACSRKVDVPFTCTPASVSGMTNSLDGYGYGLISIVEEVKTCDPKTSCCYDKNGKYNSSYSGTSQHYRCPLNNLKGGTDCPFNPIDEEYNCQPKAGCPDDVETTVCKEDGSEMSAHFYENKDIKNCTMNDNVSNSGFTMLNVNFTLDGSNTKNYCKVSCREEYDLSFPTEKIGASGRYFLLNQNIPTIKAKRVCVTNSINYDGFMEDMSNAEKEMALNYNAAQDNAYIANTAQSSGSKYGSITNSHPGGLFNYTNRSDNVDRGTTTSTGSCGTDTVYDEETKTKKCINYVYWTIYNWHGHNTMPLLNGHVHVNNRSDYTNGATYASAQSDFDGDSWNIGSPPGCACGFSGASKWASSVYEAQQEIVGYYQSIVNNYNGRINTNKNYYTHYKSQYANAQKQYKMCTSNDSNSKSWLSDYENYGYKFKPQVTFEYEEQGSTFYPTSYTYDYDEKNGDVKVTEDTTSSKKGDKSAKYYGQYSKNDYANNEYSNINNTSQTICNNNYNLLDCVKNANGNVETCNMQLQKANGNCKTADGNKRDSYGQSFANDRYIKRIETITYEYHMPIFKTFIPNGRTDILHKFNSQSSNTSLSNNELILEEEAVPININTPEKNKNSQDGKYNYSISIKNIINSEDRDRRSTSKNMGYTKKDNIDQRFYYTNNKGALNDGNNKRYLCEYEVVNEIYDPVKQRTKFFYKPIDLTDSNPIGRERGFNWNPEYSLMDIDAIEKNMKSTGEDFQLLTNDSNVDKFEFVLTPNIMKSIRKYNKSSDDGYADWTLKCNGNGGESDYYCESQFLTCFASAGILDCNINRNGTLFEGNVLNKYYDLFGNNPYNESSLNANREILKNKIRTYAIRTYEKTRVGG